MNFTMPFAFGLLVHRLFLRVLEYCSFFLLLRVWLLVLVQLIVW